ncbi:MAG: hypothetical protein BGO31_12800 [Bacteroidetes bacterium 43-16]|nr:MAG: hypothetical protein BGO31_12800 [Bacteroidetes bacterium 43-16]
MLGLDKKDIVRELREQLLAIQGFKRSVIGQDVPDFGLNAMAPAFPFGVLPLGAVHEFISPTSACATAANGFVAGLLSTLMTNDMSCLWVSTKRSLFPAGLTYFGIQPHRIVFIDVRTDREALWVMEQALKCNALVAVVAELGELSFAQSQRLQLAVEDSKVTGFLHRKRPRRENTLACVSRWKIRPIASHTAGNMPGVGIPVWEVRLEKIRNGKPGTWYFGWKDGAFISIKPQDATVIKVPKIERYA